jgi:HAD superfamily hydrolase (TIGR01549 family)
MSRAANLRLPRAIFFDMDGTITRPLLDFDAIRRDLGITGPILEALRHLHGEDLLEAHRILDDHERAASEQSELNDGCIELLDDLAANGCRTALITRNSRGSTEIILAKHRLKFDVVFTREDEPAKPDPEALYRAMKLLECRREDVWMVGDGSHDIEAAEAAGVVSVWISHGTPRQFEAEPTITIELLHELLPMLKTLRHSPTGRLRV